VASSDKSPYSPPEALLEGPGEAAPRPLWLAVLAAVAAFLAFGMVASLVVAFYFGWSDEAGALPELQRRMRAAPNFGVFVAVFYGCTAAVAGLVGAAVHRGRWLIAPLVTAALITGLIAVGAMISHRGLNRAQLGAIAVLFAGSLTGGWIARGRAR
jgi:hypothetical protein